MTRAFKSVVWCDIPVNDLDRAIKFYEAVIGLPIRRSAGRDGASGILPHDGDDFGTGACLVPAEAGGTPSANGALIYVNCQGRLDEAITAAAAHGGAIVRPKQAIGEDGFRAVVIDSEGNRIALHSR